MRALPCIYSKPDFIVNPSELSRLELFALSNLNTASEGREANSSYGDVGGWVDLCRTFDRLAVNSTHSNSSPILCRNSSTWGLFNT